jgi:hypothetical protein
VVDHEIDELELIRGEDAAIQKTGEGVLGRLAIQPDERTHEPAEAAVGAERGERCLYGFGVTSKEKFVLVANREALSGGLDQLDIPF